MDFATFMQELMVLVGGWLSALLAAVLAILSGG